MLTDKAKESFKEYLGNPTYFNKFDDLPTLMKIAYIERWLDHNKMFIFPKRLTMSLQYKEWYFIITDERGMHLNNHVSDESRSVIDSRENIMIVAIQKANEIYNNKIN